MVSLPHDSTTRTPSLARDSTIRSLPCDSIGPVGPIGDGNTHVSCIYLVFLCSSLPHRVLRVLREFAHPSGYPTNLDPIFSQVLSLYKTHPGPSFAPDSQPPEPQDEEVVDLPLLSSLACVEMH